MDLTITKADSPDPVCAASWPAVPAGPPNGVCLGGLTYTFVVGNSGIEDATGVVVRDPLPAGLIFDHVTIAGGFTCAYDPSLNVLTCTGNVPAQSTRTIAFVAVAPSGLGSINNTVTVDPNNAIFEADETNNTFTQTTLIATGIDLTIAKTSNHAGDFVATRGTLTYTITVTNLGTQDAANILVRDTLPADTIFRDAIADPAHGFSCSLSGGVVSCSGGRLQGTESMNYPNPAGTAEDKATITIRIFATPYEQPAMHNEVRVDPLGQIAEVNELNNLATQDTQSPERRRGQRRVQRADDFQDPAVADADQHGEERGRHLHRQGRTTGPTGHRHQGPRHPAGGLEAYIESDRHQQLQQPGNGRLRRPHRRSCRHTRRRDRGDDHGEGCSPRHPGPISRSGRRRDNSIPEGTEFNNSASAQTIVKNGGDVLSTSCR